MNTITITQPDDWHIHLRDGEVLPHTVADASRYLGRAIVMPNLQPPVTSIQQALDYRERILVACPPESSFNPLMILYLTDQTTPEDVLAVKNCDSVYGFKLYPSGATTNSAAGVTSFEGMFPIFKVMEEAEVPLLIHGEVTSPEIDIFDREKVFIEQHLTKITETFPKLKIVLEHITTRDAVDFVMAANNNVVATITAHHLLYNRNTMLVGGIKPHFYCLPILKRNIHQEALRKAATSGSPKFFMGTDSAPHPKSAKESACGCAGSYTAHCSVELYAEVFEEEGKLDQLEGFTSFYGADFYNLPRNEKKITLKKEAWKVDSTLEFGSQSLVPIRAGEEVAWKVAE
ncbi:MAG: dihydroorotase [bacterium]|jgi:dihydroorotase